MLTSALGAGEDPEVGKDWRWKEKGVAEDEIVDRITDSMGMSLSKFQEIVKDRGDCSPWGRKELDMT